MKRIFAILAIIAIASAYWMLFSVDPRCANCGCIIGADGFPDIELCEECGLEQFSGVKP